MSTAPSEAQQKGLAYAPIPFALLSLLCCSFVIHHLLLQEPDKRRRLYQRLVLAMNVALVIFSMTFVWSTTAVPKGTPNYAGAYGTVATCTARGFINLMFELVIPIYYASLSLQAYLSIRNNFKEEKYKWVEKWIHAIAFVVPFVVAVVIAATENFNPSGTGCWIAKAPRGCESDPDMPCTRGRDITYFVYIVLFGKCVLYFVLPPVTSLSMYFWLKKIQRCSNKASSDVATTSKLVEIREMARKKMMQTAYLQISVYLFSFWFTWVFGVSWFVYRTLTGDMAYNFLIFVNCVMASQGSVFTAAYFSLQRIGRSRAKLVQGLLGGPKRQSTVSEIRSNAERKSGAATSGHSIDDETEETFEFNIFDGTPDKDSPWAMFVDTADDYYDTNEEKVLTLSELNSSRRAGVNV